VRSADNPIPANDTRGKPANSPVSSTNETPLSSEGSFDKALQESVEKGEERRVMQSPNRATVWSKSQNPREKAMAGPRFEQTIMADQVRKQYERELLDIEECGADFPGYSQGQWLPST